MWYYLLKLGMEQKGTAMKKFYKSICAFVAIALISGNAVAQFSPPNIAGLALWLRADSGVVTSGSSVTQWKDVSGNNINATPATSYGFNAPTLGTAPELNNAPTVKFSGTQGLASTLNIPNVQNSSLTIFLLVKGYNQTGSVSAGFLNINDYTNGLWLQQNISTGNYRLLSNFNTNSSSLDIAGAAPITGFPYKIFGYQKNFGTDVRLYLNGTQGAIDNTTASFNGAFTNGPYMVGFSNTFAGLNGEIAEIIVYTSALNTSQRNQVENYLRAKYAPGPVSLGANINQTTRVCPVTLTPNHSYTNYVWSNASTGSTLAVTSNGTYSVTVTDAWGTTSSASVSVTLANMKLNKPALDTICLGSSLSIGTQLSSTTPFTFLWSNSATTATINATTAGQYYVTVKDSALCTKNSDTLTLTVDNFRNTVSLGPDTGLCSGNLIGLASPASSTWGSLGFHWSTNANTSTIPVTTANNYSVTVTDFFGCTASSTFHVAISGSAPTVGFTAPASICLGTNYVPVDTTDTIHQVIQIFRWDFGDGTSTVTGYNATHTYTTAGTYTVKLTDINSAGCSNIMTRQIVVNGVPVAAFTADTACANNSYQFLDQSVYPSGNNLGTTQWLWNFGDAGTSTSQNPLHAYSATGTYNVSLKVTSSGGCISNYNRSVTVVNTFSLPQVFMLQSPANGSAIQTSSVTFKWAPSTNAYIYSLIVSTDPTFATNDSLYNGISGTRFTTVLPANNKYYWKVTAYNICNQSIASVVDTFNIFSPNNFAGLALWLEGDSGVTISSGKVSQWNDISGNNIHCYQATPSNQPTLVTESEFLNKPAIRFSGTATDGLKSTLNIPHYNDSSLTVFMLVKGLNQTGSVSAGFLNVNDYTNGLWLQQNISTGNYRMLCNLSLGTSAVDVVGAAPATGFPYRIFGFQKNRGQYVRLDTNGVMGGINTSDVGSITTPFTNAPYVLGYSNTFAALHGDIAEIIVYTTALNSTQKATVENYLYNKYSPPVNLGPDIVRNDTFCPFTLDPGNRFLSYRWSTGATTQTIQVAQSGTYSVTTVDVFNRTSSSSVHVTMPSVVLNQPVNASLCAGSTLNIGTTLAHPGNFTYLWKSGATTPTITTSTTGSYYVKVTDATGCFKYSDTITVSTDNFASTVSLGPDTSMCGGSQLGLASPSTGWNNLQFHWSAGNATTSTVSVSTAGGYSVTVTDAANCSGSSSVNVSVSGTAPNTSFTSPSQLCYGQLFSPQNLTTGASNYLWSFGDGQTSTQPSPVYLYSGPGTYTVSLKATSGGVCSNTVTQQVTVIPGPVAMFNADTACSNNAYQFTDLSSVSGSTITQWHWNFGDNSNSNIQNPSHTYSSAGSNAVTLAVTSSNGCVDSVTHNITVVNTYTSAQVPTLQTPVNGAALQSQSVTLSWSGSTRAVSYSVTYSNDSTFSTGNTFVSGISTTHYNGSFNSNSPFFWKVTAYNICNDSVTSTVNTFSIFVPSNIGGLGLWLAADTGVTQVAGKVSQWNDIGPNHINCYQAISSNQPTYGTAPEFLNKPTIKFSRTATDGLNSTLPIPGYNNSSLTVFMVVKGYAQNAGDISAGILNVNNYSNGLWLQRNTVVESYKMLTNFGGAGALEIPGACPNVGFPYKILGFEKSLGVSVALDTNGVRSAFDNTTSSDNSSFTNGNYTIGYSSGFAALNGEVAEIIAYTAALTSTQKQQVENYLYNKYSPPVNLGPDIVENYSFCPKTLDPGSRFISYRWSTGATTQTIQVNQSGTYAVTTIDVFNRQSSSSINVTLPTLTLNQPATASVCSGSTLNIATQLASTNNYTFTWSNSAQSATINVSLPATYAVTVTDTAHCTKVSNSLVVTLDNFPTTVSLGNDTNLCSGNVLGLASPPSGWNNLQFHWSANTGNATTATVPISNSGQYAVTVTNSNSCTGSSFVNVTIIGVAPTVTFTANTSQCFGIPFVPQNTTNGATGFQWNFGDGNGASTQTNPTYNYASPGTYTVTLRGDSAGCSNVASQDVTILSGPSSAFVADTACINNPYQFTDLSTSAGGAITQWHWNFGDGNSSTLQNPAHQYTALGSYQVTLTVYTASGCVDSVTHSIRVVTSVAAAQAPQLQTPVNNAALQSSTITFAWAPAAHAVGYSLTVSTDPGFASGNSFYTGITGINFTTTLTGNQTYYWRVTAYNSCNDSSQSVANTFSIFVPSNFGGLALWLEADSGVVQSNGKVSQWNDVSGNNINCYQATASNQPTYSTAAEFLNKPTIVFSNTASAGLTSTLNIPHYGDSSLTVFMLVKGYAQSTGTSAGFLNVNNYNNGLWLQRNMNGGEEAYKMLAKFNGPPSGVTEVYGSTPNIGFPYKIFGFEKNLGVGVALDTNGVHGAVLNGDATSNGPFSNGPYTIGYSNGFTALNGEVAEIIVYTTALSSTQKATVENYLYNKYSPPVTLGPDIVQTYSLCPVVLDPGSRFISYLWNTGATTQTISVTHSGTYSITAVDVFNRTSSATVHVTLPDVNLNQPANTSICQGTTVTIGTNLASSANYTFVWSNGANTPTISTGVVNNYSVVVSDINGCSANSDTITTSIDAFASTVSLGSSSANLCSGNTLSLVSPPASTWPSLTFNWQPAGNSSTVQVANSGTYSVTVTNAAGCAGTASINVNVIGVAPTLNFSGDTLCLGIAYDPHNTTDTSGQQISSFLWHFNDGSTSSQYNPTHIYNNAGIYNDSLTITSTSGCSNTLSRTVLVKDAPQAAFNSGTACVANAYQFTDLSNPPAGSTLTQWAWDFGDGNNSTLQNPTNTYNNAIGYTVTLTVTASNGCSGSTTGNIQVVSSSTLPPAAVLQLPVNGSVASSNVVTFSWANSPGVSQYSLLVSPDPTFSSQVSHFNNLTNTQLVDTLSGNQTYYWRVIAYNICGQATISLTDTFTVFDPSNLQGLALWLKGDDGPVTNGNAVSEWDDRSGNNGNVYQSNTLQQPTLSTENLLNFKPALNFTDAAQSALNSTQVIPGYGNSSLNVFIVTSGKTQTSFVNAGILNAGDVLTGNWIDRGFSDSSFRMLNNYGSSGNSSLDIVGAMPPRGFPFALFEVAKNLNVLSRLFKNSVQAVSNTGITQTFTNGNFMVGHSAGFQSINGGIAEIIVYASAQPLSETNRQLVEKYIYDKYAPPVNLGPDIIRAYSICPVVLDAQDRFVSYLWSTGDTTHAITVRKSGTFWVRTVDVFGHTSSDTINVRIPYGGITPKDTVICYGSSVQIKQLLNRPNQYQYNWQDGRTGATITAAQAGLYTATITDDSGCTYISDTAFVHIDSFNISSLLPTDTNICGNSGLWVNSGSYAVASYLWSPGGATTASPPITSAGLYKVTATDVNGCRATDSTNVTVHGTAPIADFTVVNFCSNDTIKFTDQSHTNAPDVISAWHWSFGDTTSANTTNANHIYQAAGQYNVTLSITTDSGCTAAKTIITPIYPSPDALFTYAGSNPAIPYALCAGNYTLFNDMTPAADSVISRQWIIDGVVNSVTLPTFQYRLPNQGANFVTLIVTTNKGCTAKETQEVDVFPALIADFTYTGACFGDTTRFVDATQSHSVVTRVWDFGDNVIGFQQNPKHVYRTANTYDVTLTITNAIGCMDHILKTINVVNSPVVDFTGGSACQNQSYQPVDVSVPSFGDTVNHWVWNIDGVITSGKTPPAQFIADTGIVNVQLTISTSSGCVDSISKNLVVQPSPVANFIFNPLYGSAPVDITFTNKSQLASTYVWNFDDGGFSSDANPVHTYSNDGTYNIILYAYSDAGCVDSIVRTFVSVQTDLDLAIEKISTVEKAMPDGSTLITVVAAIRNLGTRIITSAQLYATIGNGDILEQDWNGVLESGHLVIDTFASNFVVTGSNANTYLCVQARNVNDGETEVRYDNNMLCQSLDGTLQLVGPSPSPAMTESRLGLIMPKQGTVVIDIADITGKCVIHQLKLDLPAGRTDFDIPIGQMAATEYFIRVKYNDDTQTRKLIVR